MKKHKSPSEIVKELKKQHGLKGADAEILLERIEAAYERIIVAEGMMKKDSEVEVVLGVNNAGQSEVGCVPYGFTRDRFGNYKTHPALEVIEKAEASIRSALKVMNVKTDRESKETEVKSGLIARIGGTR